MHELASINIVIVNPNHNGNLSPTCNHANRPYSMVVTPLAIIIFGI
jgi:hypothetical protein